MTNDVMVVRMERIERKRERDIESGSAFFKRGPRAPGKEHLHALLSIAPLTAEHTWAENRREEYTYCCGRAGGGSGGKVVAR